MSEKDHIDQIDLLKIFADDKRMMIYRPQWRQFTGSVTSTILLQQIVFHWEKNGRKSFYKFKEPCTHRLYKPGDSWCEELGFGRKEFDSAVKKIGFKKSKTNKTKHAMPVEYWITSGRETYYAVHIQNLHKHLMALYGSKPEISSENDETVNDSADSTVTTERDVRKSPKGDVVTTERDFTGNDQKELYQKPERDSTKTPKRDLQVTTERDFTKSPKGTLYSRTETTTEKKTTANSASLPQAAALPGFSSFPENDLNNLVNQVSVSVSKKRRQWIADHLNTYGYDYMAEKIAYANKKAQKATYWGYLSTAISENHGAGFLTDQDPAQDVRTIKPEISIPLINGQFVEYRGEQSQIFDNGFAYFKNGLMTPGDLQKRIKDGSAVLIPIAESGLSAGNDGTATEAPG